MNINETNYENYFLLYIDNELTAEQKAEVDVFVLSNPSYAELLSEFKNTTLEATEELYADKALLYRFDEMEAGLDVKFKASLYRHQQAPIVKFNFNKKLFSAALSVAALFSLFIGYRFYTQANENSTVTALALYSNIESKSQLPISSNLDGPATVKKELTSAAYIAVLKNTIVSDKVLPHSIYEKKGTQKNELAILNNGIPSTLQNVASSTLSKNTEIAYHTIEAKPLEASVSNISAGIEDNTNATQVAEATNATLYEEIETDRPDRIIYISSFEIDGDKLRGFTRKVNALFKRNKTDREK